MSKKQEKAPEMIRIRTITEYLQEFGNDGIGKGVPVATVKEQILDAFRKEIFDQITWKLKISDIQEVKETPENRKIVENIMKNTYKKFIGVIKAFNRFRETLNMLRPEDLQILQNEHEMYDPFDGFDDEEEEENEEITVEEAADAGGMAENPDGEGSQADGATVPAGEADDGPVNGDYISVGGTEK